MLTTDQIIYFINHIADADHADRNLRLWQAFWIILAPGAIGLFHLVKLPQFFRGSDKNLGWIIISMFWWSVILPLIIALHSLLYIGDYKDIFYMVLLYIFYATLYVIGIQEYFPRYRYTTDSEYDAATAFLDSSLINKEYPDKTRLYAVAIWVMLSAIFICGGGLVAAILVFNKLPNTIATVIFCIGTYMLIIHLMWFRWLVKCPNCHRPIYNIKYNKEGKNDNIYFVKVAWSVLTKKKCDCVTCHATYYVK